MTNSDNRNKFGRFSVGNKVTFEYDDGIVVGYIESITRYQIIVRPVSKKYESMPGHRISLAKSMLNNGTYKLKDYVDVMEEDDGSFSL